MMRQYDGNYVLALAAYYDGSETVQKDAPQRKLSHRDNFLFVQKTERHVEKILNCYYEYKSDALLKRTDLGKLDKLLAGRAVAAGSNSGR
jgi:hypothetical protein